MKKSKNKAWDTKLEKYDIIAVGGNKDDIVSITSSLALKDILDVKSVVLKNSRHITHYLSSKSGECMKKYWKKFSSWETSVFSITYLFVLS